MAKTRGKRLALGLLAAVTVMVVLAAVLLRETIQEHYHILRLASDQPEARERSLEKLVELSSVRAVPAIIRMKVRLADPSYDPLPDIAARRKKELIPLLESLIANDRTDRKVRCFAMYVLSEMAGPVELPVPALEVALGSADGQVREFARVAAQELQRRGLEREKRGTLGVVVGEKRDGSLPVKYVTPGGAAARVSIKESDVLLKANGRPLQQMDDLARVLRDAHVGDAVALVIQRGTQQLRRTVILDSQATWENVLPRLWEP